MASHAMKITLERIALFQFTPAHSVQARAMLGWSVEELSRESGVSVDAIQPVSYTHLTLPTIYSV